MISDKKWNLLRLARICMVNLLWPFLAVAQQPGEELTGPMVTFRPEHQKPVSYGNGTVEVTLVTVDGRRVLRIAERETRSERTVLLPKDMAQVDTIGAYGNKLVVFGMVNGTVWEVAVVDWTVGKLVDGFICYGPSLSSSGRYIAFIKFSPPHVPGNFEDHYMLYDTGRDPGANRPPGVASDDRREVGRSVFPRGVGNQPGDNAGVPPGTEHVARSDFFWVPSSEQFLFADRIGSSGSLNLVFVDISSSGNVTVKTLEQPIRELCREPQNDIPRCNLLMRKVNFNEAGFSAVWEVVETRQLRTVQYSFSQFH